MTLIKKIINSILIIIILLANVNFSGQPDEYVIKGVLLEKISTFIQWPENDKDKIKDNEFVVGIIGKHKFAGILKKLYSKRKILNKELVVKNISSNSEINKCSVIFIPKLNDDELNEILEFVKKKPILTISDTEGYAEKGVHVNFYTEGSNIRFEINERSVKESGILMNHLLLSLAKLVENEK